MTGAAGGWTSPGGEPADGGSVPAGAPAPAYPPPTAPAPTGGPPGAPGWSPAPGGWSGTPGWQPPPGWGQPRPPEPKPGVVPLRPLGLGELLDGAVGLIRRYPRPALGLSAVLAVLVTVLNITLALTVLKPVLRYDFSTFTGGSDPAAVNDLERAAAGLGSLITSIISGLAAIVLAGIMTAIAGRGVLGQPMSLGDAWQQVRPRLGRLVGIALLTSLLVYGSVFAGIAVAVLLVVTLGPAAALLGVPVGIGGVCLGVYLYCRLSLASCAAVLERAGIRRSLTRSGILVRRSWWRVFGVLALAVIVGAVVAQVVQGPFAVLGLAPTLFHHDQLSAGTTTRLLVFTYVGSGIAQTVVAPFTAGVRALLYIDRRMRAEGLDVALNAAAAQRSP